MAGKWTRASLGELIEFTRDGEWGSDQPSLDTMEMLVVRGTDFPRLRVGALADIPKRYIERGAAERKQLRVGDVLIETAGGTKDQSTGRTALVKQSHIERAGLPLTCASFARFMRFDHEKVNPGFVYWWLQSLHACGEMEKHQVQHTGVARFQFTKFVESTEVPLPPLSEQRAIAHILGMLDDKIELNRRMNETLEAMVRALFKSWFVDFDPVLAKAEGRDPGLPKPLADLFPDRLVDSELGQTPEGWAVEALVDHFNASKGVSYKGSGLADSGMPLHNLNSVYEGGGYKYQGIKYYTGEFAERHIVQPGDVIVANTEQGHDRLLIGYAAIVPRLFGDRGIASHHIYRLRAKPDSPLTAAFLCHLLNSPQMHDLVSGYANGTTVNMLPMDGVQKPAIVCPPRPLVATFDSLGLKAEQRREEMVSESRTLAALRDALLPKLISGELRVENADAL